MSLNHRITSIRKMLSHVEHVLLIGSGKGGVGKSLIAALLSIKLSSRGFKVGLLDLDLHGPIANHLLPVGSEYRESKDGILPPEFRGVKVVSLSHFVSEDKPIPLKGVEKEDTIIDLLSIINWGSLDFLVVDLPPGTGEEVIVTCRVIKRPKHAILVTLPSKVSFSVMIRALKLIRSLGANILGVVVNMAGMKCGDSIVKPLGTYDVREALKPYDTKVILEIPLDPRVSIAIDEKDFNKLLTTEASNMIEQLADMVVDIR